MSVRKRAQTFTALIAGSVVAGRPEMARLQLELTELSNSVRVWRRPRRFLLHVLHSTRTLDTFLYAFTDYHGCRGNAHALGRYLTQLVNHQVATIQRLPIAERNRFQAAIVNLRNRYMHQAGEFPANVNEISLLLSEMDACLARVLSL